VVGGGAEGGRLVGWLVGGLEVVAAAGLVVPGVPTGRVDVEVGTTTAPDRSPRS